MVGTAGYKLAKYIDTIMKPNINCSFMDDSTNCNCKAKSLWLTGQAAGLPGKPRQLLILQFHQGEHLHMENKLSLSETLKSCNFSTKPRKCKPNVNFEILPNVSAFSRTEKF